MIAWLWNIIVGQLCQHKWKLIEKRPVFVERQAGDLPTYHKFIMQCEKCGNIKVKKT